MAGGIVYLDIDDEITSAASRIRDASSRRVALVLPYGSRVATSRINFRLLSRDAMISEKQLSVVAGDSATRALAASAGLPVFGTVGEYEASLAGLVEPPDPGPPGPPAAEPAAPATPTNRPRRASSKAKPPPDGTADPTPAAAVGAATIEAQAGASVVPATRKPSETTVQLELPPEWAPGPEYPRAERRQAIQSPRSVESPRSIVPQPRPGLSPGSRLPLVVGLAVVGLVILVGSVAAYVMLPAATIVVAPRAQSLPPLELTVTADPSVTEPDATGLVVPAQVISLDVSASDTFPATGKRIEEADAKGTVRFANLDFLRSNTVPKGSVVSTNAGVRFETVAAVTVPRADLVGLTVFPGRIAVNVIALEPGTAGNVEPNTIVIVPKGEDPQALKVVNPDATSGGTHEEFPQVAQADVDGALEQLTTALTAAFDARLGDPSIAPTGAMVFRTTAVLGDPTQSVDPATLVGQEVDSFDLGLSATGTVVAVDPAPVGEIADERLRATVDSGHQLVAGSVDVQVGQGIASGQSVSFSATASAQQVAVLDADVLRGLVLGKSLDDAREILAPFGEVELTAWPDWVSAVPTIAGRVEVRIDTSVPVEAPSASDPGS